MRERTRQQLDPAGTTGVRVFSNVVSLGAFLYATVATVAWQREISSVPLAIAALALLAAGIVILVVETSPFRAPLRRGGYLLVLGCALLSYFSFTWATIGHNPYVRDDWGPLVLGVLLLALGPYRPGREIAVTGVALACFVGLVVIIEKPYFATDAPPVAFVLLAVTPLLAMCFGSVANSVAMVTAIERWQRRAGVARVSEIEELRSGVARSIQQDRVTILSRDVLPFFTELVAAPSVTEADRSRAREIAHSIRNVMVEEADRSWLETAVVIAGGARPGQADAVVEDSDRLAAGMTIDQRTAVRALVVALVREPEFAHDDLHIHITRDGDLCRVIVSTRFSTTDTMPRAALSPYFALLRSVFDAFDVDFDHPSLRLRFWYEQH